VIQARNEADITPQHILKRMNESSGSKYSSAPVPAPTPTTKPTPKPYTAPSSSFVRSTSTTTAPTFARSSAPSPAVAQPPPPAAPPAAPPVSASTPAAEAPKSTLADDRIAPVGTAYTPVSLPKPKKLGNRWGPGAVPVGGSDDEHEEKSGGAGVVKPSAFASARSAFGGGGAPTSSGGAKFGGSAGAVGGAGKKLTWSERQAEAKRQREEEERAAEQGMVPLFLQTLYFQLIPFGNDQKQCPTPPRPPPHERTVEPHPARFTPLPTRPSHRPKKQKPRLLLHLRRRCRRGCRLWEMRKRSSRRMRMIGMT
jgi:hypothetical protein